MKHYHLIVFVFLSCFSIAASAQEKVPWREAFQYVKKEDSKILPPWCGVNVDPRYKNVDWNKRWGGPIGHINHYCEGKAKIPVCYRYPEKEKKECLTYFLEGTTYALQNPPPNHPLLPFLYTEHGDLLKEIGRYSEAIQSYNTAIQKNNKYIRAYAMLADTYILTKQYDEAEKAINEGLKYKESPALSKKLNKIKALKK